MEAMYTRNSGSMHDELIQMVGAEILLLFDYDSHSDIEIEDLIDASVEVTHEALDNLVSKGLLHRNKHFIEYYEISDAVQDEINRITYMAIVNSNLLREGK